MKMGAKNHFPLPFLLSAYSDIFYDDAETAGWGCGVPVSPAQGAP